MDTTAQQPPPPPDAPAPVWDTVLVGLALVIAVGYLVRTFGRRRRRCGGCPSCDRDRRKNISR